jgi:hypothetical protein
MCYMDSLHHVVDHYCLLHLPPGTVVLKCKIWQLIVPYLPRS